MEPQLEAVRKQLEAIRADAEVLVKGMSDAQLTWHPSPGVWSITDCFAHLNSIDGQDMPNFFKAITAAKKDGITVKGPFRWNWFERWFIRSIEPPVRMKFKAPKKYVPQPDPDPKDTILQFQMLQNDLHFLIAQADGIDLKNIKLASPAAKWLKMSIGARFELLAAHDRRHLWQARRISEFPDFPKS